MAAFGDLHNSDKSMDAVINRLSQRYEHYAKMLAEKLQCNFNEVSPYFYMCIAAVTNYMLFGKSGYIDPQIEVIEKNLRALLDKER